MMVWWEMPTVPATVAVKVAAKVEAAKVEAARNQPNQTQRKDNALTRAASYAEVADVTGLTSLESTPPAMGRGLFCFSMVHTRETKQMRVYTH